MKVKELIDILSRLDQDKEVLVFLPEDLYRETWDIVKKVTEFDGNYVINNGDFVSWEDNDEAIR